MKQKFLHGLLSIVLALVFSFSLPAQVIQTHPSKQNPTVDYKRLERIDTLINGYIKNDWEKGVVTIIVKDNQLVQYKGYGYADAATKKPMVNNTIFRIMSQTKAIVSVGAMMLYEKGKFLLDEPVAGVNPTLAKRIFEKIQHLQKEESHHYVIIEHNMDVQLNFCDYLFVFNKGQIVAQGTPEEIRKNKDVLDAYLGY